MKFADLKNKITIGVRIMTITILDLIDANTQLSNKADKFYKEIENWYRQDDRGHVVNYPMNIPAREKGESDREDQNNAYVVGRRYFRFLNLDLNPKNVKDLLDEFVEKFISSEDFLDSRRQGYTALEATHTQSKIYTLPARFIPQYDEFRMELADYYSLLINYKPDPKREEIELRMVFAKMASRLIKEDECTLAVVNEACNKARSTIGSKSGTLDAHDIYKLYRQFCGMMVYRFFSYSFDPKTNKFALSLEEADEQVSKLTNFLEKLPNLQTLDKFQSVFAETLFVQTRSQKNAWNSVTLFQTNQHLLNNAALEKRQNLLKDVREFSGFKKATGLR